jgi:hypothetical protein
VVLVGVGADSAECPVPGYLSNLPSVLAPEAREVDGNN